MNRIPRIEDTWKFIPYESLRISRLQLARIFRLAIIGFLASPRDPRHPRTLAMVSRRRGGGDRAGNRREVVKRGPRAPFSRRLGWRAHERGGAGEMKLNGSPPVRGRQSLGR